MNQSDTIDPELQALMEQHGCPVPPHLVPERLRAQASALVARQRRSRILISQRAALQAERQKQREAEAARVAAERAAGRFIPPAVNVTPKPAPNLPRDLDTAGAAPARMTPEEALEELKKVAPPAAKPAKGAQA